MLNIMNLSRSIRTAPSTVKTPVIKLILKKSSLDAEVLSSYRLIFSHLGLSRDQIT